MEYRRVLRAERLCLLVYLGKMRPISGLEAVFQFLFLILLKHRLSAIIHKHEAYREVACAHQNPALTRTLTHMLTHEGPSGADSILARLPYLSGS